MMLKDYAAFPLARKTNLDAAMTMALLLLPEQFTLQVGVRLRCCHHLLSASETVLLGLAGPSAAAKVLPLAMLAAMPASPCQSSHSLYHSTATSHCGDSGCAPCSALWPAEPTMQIMLRLNACQIAGLAVLCNLTVACRPRLWILPKLLLWLQELFAKICGVSYIGDVRMGFAEDSRKVERIAAGSAAGLAQMYNKRFKVGGGL